MENKEQDNGVEIYVFDDMGHISYKYMDKNNKQKPYVPVKLWNIICMHVPDYRDEVPDNRKGFPNKKMIYVVDNITYIITYELYKE